MLKTRWKHHKSKGLNFLHRNCTQFFFSTPKNIFSGIDRKKVNKKKWNFSKFFRNIKKINKISMKNYMIFIENFDFFNFGKFSNIFFFFTFFRSISEKIFFGVEKQSWVQFRCKKSWSFDLWCFQSDSGTLSWVLGP